MPLQIVMTVAAIHVKTCTVLIASGTCAGDAMMIMTVMTVHVMMNVNVKKGRTGSWHSRPANHSIETLLRST